MEEKMYAYKCTACGQLHHPKHYVCNLPEGYMKPYIGFGIVKFANDLVVTGQLEVENPEIGMKLRSTVGVVKEGIGKDYFGFIFKAI